MIDKIRRYFVIFVPIILGSIVGLIVDTTSYSMVNKPSVSPPGVVFPIVWSILYLIMGYSYYKSNRDCGTKKVYYGQLIVNLLWPFLFFSFRLYLFSSLWILLLIVLVIDMIVKFYQDKKVLGYINLPYLVWLIFAFYLSISVYLLN